MLLPEQSMHSLPPSQTSLSFLRRAQVWRCALEQLCELHAEMSSPLPVPDPSILQPLECPTHVRLPTHSTHRPSGGNRSEFRGGKHLASGADKRLGTRVRRRTVPAGRHSLHLAGPHMTLSDLSICPVQYLHPTSKCLESPLAPDSSHGTKP